MAEALSFLRAFEAWIYLLLGLGALIYIRKFILAWRELQDAGFGLERESAQSRLNLAAGVLLLILTLGITEFMLVSFVAPTVPGANPLLTPTVNLLATPTATLPSSQATVEAGEATSTPTQVQAGASACQPDQISILSPTEGQTVSDVVEVKGTADIPNFGFYKIEMKRPEETIWQTIVAGNEVKKDEALGLWDTRRLFSGTYQLGLVVVDNEARASAPCVVQVQVMVISETATP
jgi:hypothetical protein